MQVKTWSLGWMFAISAACACVIFAAALVAFPKDYVSRGTLVLDGTPPFTQADLDSMQRVAQQVESRDNLTHIIASLNLYRRERTRMKLEDILDRMRRNVKIDPAASQGSQKIVAIAFDYPDPQVAQRVNQVLIGAVIDQHIRAGGAPPSIAVLDPASLPLIPTRSIPNLVAVSAFAGLLILGVLALLRRRALRKG